jgi:hypothetical protein
MGAASALGRDASILSPLSQAFERTRLERADRTGAHLCFALAERSSQEAGPAQLVVVHFNSSGGVGRLSLTWTAQEPGDREAGGAAPR